MYSKQLMDIRVIYRNQEMAMVHTAAVISMIADRDRGSIRWRFALADIAPISKMVSNRKWLYLMGSYGLDFLRGWLWYFEQVEAYEWCAEINEVIKKYE